MRPLRRAAAAFFLDLMLPMRRAARLIALTMSSRTIHERSVVW